MRRIFTVFAVVVLLFGLALAIGASRPRAHVASSAVDLDASIDEVWARLADLETWPKWNTEIERMEHRADVDGRAAWVVHGSWGAMPMEIAAVEPGARIETVIPEDAEIGFRGSWTYALAPRDGGGCTVTITERGEVGSPFFRFVMIFAGYHSTQLQFLRDLAAELGEDASPHPLE